MMFDFITLKLDGYWMIDPVWIWMIFDFIFWGG